MAKAEPTPSVQQRLNKLRAQLLAESLKRRAENQEDEDDEGEDEDTETAPPTSGPPGAGPVVGSIPREGKGYGVGSGTGSEGMLQDPDFVLYYQAVQDKIKKAWSFMGGSSDLTATVDFSIGPDGSLTGVKLAAGSKDSAFDDSVIRAIRRAAPFPAPPDKYRSEFMQGIKAQFALGDLRS
jgi:TonB family protein